MNFNFQISKFQIIHKSCHKSKLLKNAELSNTGQKWLKKKNLEKIALILKFIKIGLIFGIGTY